MKDLDSWLLPIFFYLLGVVAGAWRGYKRGYKRGAEATTLTSTSSPFTTVLVNSKVAGDDYILYFSDGNKYRGSGTVWHSYPDGRRCDATVERKLCDAYTRLKWEREEAAKKAMIRNAQSMMSMMSDDSKKNRVA